MDSNRGILMFGVGFAAGIAAAFMLRSESGQETMGYLRTKADEGAQAVKESVGHLSDAVTDAAVRGAKAVRYQTENVAAALDAGKTAFKAAQKMTP